MRPGMPGLARPISMRRQKLRCQPCKVATRLRSKCTIGFHMSEPYAKIQTSSVPAGFDFIVSASERSIRSVVQRFGRDSKWSRYSPELIACLVSMGRRQLKVRVTPSLGTPRSTPLAAGHKAWRQYGDSASSDKRSYGRRCGDREATIVPLPVSIARAFGARVVIAINLNADRFGRGATISSHGSNASDLDPALPAENGRNGFLGLRGMFGAERAVKRQIITGRARPGFSTVMVESFNIMQDRLTRMRLAGDPPDVHITPRIGHIGFLDFHRAAEAIEAGQIATERSLDPITESIAELN